MLQETPKSWQVIEKAMKNYTDKTSKRMGINALATVAKVPAGSLSNWKNGKTLPEDRTARAVTQAVNMDFEELRLLLVEERYQRELSAADDRRRIQTSGMRVDIGHVGIVPERPAGGEVDVQTSSTRKVQYTPVVREPSDFNEYTEVAGVVRIPVLASIPAGDPIEISEDLLKQVEEFEYMAPDMISDLRNVFALTISGRSMSHRKVEDGDRIIIDAGQEPEDGDLAVIRTSENEGILREVHYEGDIAVLESASGRPQIVKRDDLVFVGKVIKIMKTP